MNDSLLTLAWDIGSGLSTIFRSLSTGALSRLILANDSLRMAVNELRTSKVHHLLNITYHCHTK